MARLLQLVTPAELEVLWLDPRAVALQVDHRCDLRIVTLTDGSRYAAELGEWTPPLEADL